MPAWPGSRAGRGRLAVRGRTTPIRRRGGARLNAVGLLAAMVLGVGAAGVGNMMPREAGTVLRVDPSAIVRCPAVREAFCVVDGDTVRYGGERIRLSGIDTPEISNPGCAAEKQLGERATLRLVAILERGPFDIVDTREGRDRYGRLLRELRRDGRSIGDMLVAEGLARRWQGRKQGWCE